MPDMLPRIGIIGCGAIGSYVAAAIDSKKIPCEVSAVFDILPEAAAELSTSLSSKPPVLPMEELIGKSDIVLEAAGGGAVDSVVRSCVAAGKVLLLVSTGGLKHEHIDLFKCAENGAELHVVSGAIAGVDGILAFAKGDIESITHITRKPPKGLAGAPYLEKNAINTKDISEPLTVFEGSPEEAVAAFPKNVNVAATLALASDAPEKMKVRVVADPGININVHEIEIRTNLGNLFMRVENSPLPSNPRTSALAALSAVATLEKIISKVKIGT